MRVHADRKNNEVTIDGDNGSRITMTWSGALLLGTLLREASVEAEPPALSGRSYSLSVERDRR